jgi:hypothetical protein
MYYVHPNPHQETTMATTRLAVHRLATLAVTAALAGQPAASTFESALADFSAGRYSMAYGRFVEAANHGDSDAARFALFMVRYGPIAYGKHWSASPEEFSLWSELSQVVGRPVPAFRAQHPIAAARPNCMEAGTVGWPSDC